MTFTAVCRFYIGVEIVRGRGGEPRYPLGFPLSWLDVQPLWMSVIVFLLFVFQVIDQASNTLRMIKYVDCVLVCHTHKWISNDSAFCTPI